MKCMVIEKSMLKKSLSTVSDLVKDSVVEPMNSGLDMTGVKERRNKIKKT